MILNGKIYRKDIPMLSFSIIVAGVCLFAALVCYGSLTASTKDERQSEEYFYLKMQEMDVERRNENLKDL